MIKLVKKVVVSIKLIVFLSIESINSSLDKSRHRRITTLSKVIQATISMTKRKQLEVLLLSLRNKIWGWHIGRMNSTFYFIIFYMILFVLCTYYWTIIKTS